MAWNVLLLLVLVVSGSSVPAWARESSELDLDSSHAPYRVENFKKLTYSSDIPATTGYVMAELDGDGRLELVTADDNRLLGWDCEDGYVKPRFQINLDPGWSFHRGTPTPLGLVTDLNRDLVSEVHLTIKATDSDEWRFMTIDLANQETVLEVNLPKGKDRRPDGKWDGTYVPIGIVEDADGTGRMGVVLLCHVQYDSNPRGLLVLDIQTGETIWNWVAGPNPDTMNPVVADLDGDGNSEIVLFGTSPDNLNGDKINGTSDDHAYLFVIGPTGELIWRQKMGGIFCAGSAYVADLNGDGQPEIVTISRNNQTGQANQLIIWDYETQSPIVSQRQEATFMGLAVLPGPRTDTSWLVAGSNGGFITRYLFADGQLTRERRRVVDYTYCEVTGVVDLLPEPGRELIVDFGPGNVMAVLNAELEVQAVHVTDETSSKRVPMVWPRTFDDLALVVGDNKSRYVLDFVRNPFQVPLVAKYAGGGLLLLILLGVAFRFGQSVARRGVSEPVPELVLPTVTDREVLYRMWRQLDDVKHEKFLEANRGLRRLVWLLEAYAADLGASESLGVRIGQLMEDFTDSVRPRLLEILHLARTENFETQTVQETALALETLGTHLESLDVETLTRESVRERSEEMNAELTRIEAGFLQLWQALRQYFSTDPVRMLQGMLLVREVEFQRSAIETRLMSADVPEPLCLIDSSSLRFVLDNLVDNAIRAMVNSPDKVLRVEVERRTTEMLLRISDTGKGIETEMQENIFNGRTSDRQGGGAGLFRSREILQKWRGEIVLAKSVSGQGTTFIVKLRAAAEIEADDESVKTLYGKS